MQRRSAGWLAGASLAAAMLVATAAHASTNVALTTDGATFVGASSVTPYATTGIGPYTPENGGVPTMQNDVISATPTPWLTDGDTRYIFNHGDQDQWLEISLGKIDSIDSFGATFVPTDRAVIGPFFVETSTNGINWTQQGPSIANPGSNPDLITLGTPVNAEYIKYFFGPTSPQYGGDGSGVSEVFAAAVPEPAAWAMMLVGVFGVGATLRTARRSRTWAAA